MAWPRWSRTLNSMGSRLSLPTSIFEKSRMSLMTVSSESAEYLTAFRYSRCDGSSSVSSSQFGHPDNAVHGRADLVTHVGQEFALGAAGGIGGFLGGTHLFAGIRNLAGYRVSADRVTGRRKCGRSHLRPKCKPAMSGSALATGCTRSKMSARPGLTASSRTKLMLRPEPSTSSRAGHSIVPIMQGGTGDSRFPHGPCIVRNGYAMKREA